MRFALLCNIAVAILIKSCFGLAFFCRFLRGSFCELAGFEEAMNQDQSRQRQHAKRELKKLVREMMRDATKLAMEKLDKLEAAGAGIVQDQLDADGPYQVPREFIAAFAEEMKCQFGWTSRHDPKSRKRRIANYYVLM